MTTPFEVRHLPDGKTSRLQLSGELDLATAPALAEQIEDRIAEPTVAQLVVDLTEVSFLDSSGINALIRGHLKARDAGKSLTVTGAAGRVRAVLDISGVSGVLGLG